MMKKIIKFVLTIILLLNPITVFAQEEGKTEFYKAVVLEVENVERESNYDNEFNDWQNVSVKLLEGEHEGKEYTFENNASVFNEYDFKVETNDKIIVTFQQIGGQEIVSMGDFVRSGSIILMAIVFLVLLLVIGGVKGIRSVLGFVWIVMVIIFLLIPRIIAGDNVYFLVFLSSILIIVGASVLLAGFNKKSLLIILSSLFGLAISTFVVIIIGGWSKFSEVGLSESHLFHVSTVLQNLDLIGIVYAGMIIGSLGSMMDISISIVAGVEELINVNRENRTRKMDQKDLFASGMNIGREIMAVNANTLILAYAGSALTIWIIAISQGYSWGMLSNFNMIFVEILRIMAGTIGIFAAIPMTAWLSSKFLNFERMKGYEE